MDTTLFTPTDEQVAAIDLYRTGQTMVIEALAGTGKTSTARLMVQAVPDRSVTYTAFNRAIVDDVRGAMPDHAQAKTVHQLAMAVTGHKYRHRLGSSRMKSNDIAKVLGIDGIWITTEFGSKNLAAGYLAGLVMNATETWCQSDDPTPTRYHFRYIDGIDWPDAAGKRTYTNNNRVQDYLLPFVNKVWADAINPNGRLTYKHGYYLKQWELNTPTIHTDALIIDERQDLNGVMRSILRQQKDVQIVLLGDSQQAIYGWMGASDATLDFPDAPSTFLTQSFRFGDEIAEIANVYLAMVTDLRVVGSDVPGEICPVDAPSAVLTRTNAGGVEKLFNLLAAGVKAGIVGGAADVLAFARGAQLIMDEKWTGHPDLTCFRTWGEVQEYVNSDAQGGEIKMLVKLIDDFSVKKIIDALENQPAPRNCQTQIVTAHKSKGLGFPSVQVHSDFPDFADVDVVPSPEEIRLQYVAVSRAMNQLDVTRIPFLATDE